MTDKRSLQALSDLLQHQIDQARNVQNNIKRLNNARKDSELVPQKQILLKGLQSFTDDLNSLRRKAQDTQEDLEDELEDHGSHSSSKDERKEKTDVTSPRDQQRQEPADQENAYHLKARMMPHYFTKNKALEAELILRNRRNDLRAQRNHRQINYNRETNLSAATTLHVIHMYEKKARAAEARVDALKAEVDELRATEGGKHQGKNADESQSFLGRGNRVNDIIRKNEHLQTVVRDQSFEIQRLKRDNQDLVKKTKHAEQDRHQAMNQLSTSDKAKRDLYCRFQKQKAQHERLTRSLTQQSADWIEARKQQDQAEEEIRWRNVGHAALHGSFERTHSHHVQRNVDQPRYMYPVENYSQPVASS